MSIQHCKEQLDSSKHVAESKNMYRLRLGKTTTDFFSERGNNLLKRIWLDNNLDEEMIFSSWIGPSEAFMRQKVADYLQAFLLRRSKDHPFQDTEGLRFLRRFSINCDLPLSADNRKRHEYYNNFVQTSLNKRYEERANAERVRIEKSIAKNELPVLPGFEYVSEHPIFRAEQLEKRMKYLSKIPFPFTINDFETHILPMMTYLAIEEEEEKSAKVRFSGDVTALQCLSQYSGTTASKTVETRGRGLYDSGVASDGTFTEDSIISSDITENDTATMQMFSELDLKAKDTKNNDLDNTLSDVCEFCGGFVNCDPNEHLICNCIWDDKNGSLTALSLYADATKIVEFLTMQHVFCQEYIEQSCPKSWTD